VVSVTNVTGPSALRHQLNAFPYIKSMAELIDRDGARVPDFPILPSTKIGALLARYPELEDVLIGLAPPFKRLKNPFLRRGVAKVAPLEQAAARLQPAEILELITTFLPAPGIGVMKGKGLLVWSVRESPQLIRTYVSKSSA
jgi:hypothetical protein